MYGPKSPTLETNDKTLPCGSDLVAEMRRVAVWKPPENVTGEVDSHHSSYYKIHPHLDRGCVPIRGGLDLKFPEILRF